MTSLAHVSKLSKLLLLTMTLLATQGILSAETAVNRSLSLMNPGTSTSLRLRDDQVITDVELIATDATSLTYRNQSMTVKVPREDIYRARQGDHFYSDLPLSQDDHQKFPDYVSYIQERGDIITDLEGSQYVGQITGETDAHLTIRTRAASYDVAKVKIAAWRRDGKWYGDANAQKQPSGSILGFQPYQDKTRLLNYSLFLTGPWSALPQFGVGVSSNVNHLLFGGLRTSLGYIWLDTESMGILYQVSAHLNLNLFHIGSTRIFAGSSYLWRAGFLMPYGYSNRGSRQYDNVYADITQNIYTIHLGLKYMNLMFEAGVEMPIVRKQRFSRPTAGTASEAIEIENTVNSLQSAIDRFNDVSRVYASVALMF
ncbi:MAG: hypothetical protein ACOY5B_05040 [Spirochaetota bacterium]